MVIGGVGLAFLFKFCPLFLFLHCNPLSYASLRLSSSMAKKIEWLVSVFSESHSRDIDWHSSYKVFLYDGSLMLSPF